MARKEFEHCKDAHVSRFRWHPSRLGGRSVMRLEEIRKERGFAAAHKFANGQILAGTGALIFEGEMLELPRQH